MNAIINLHNDFFEKISVHVIEKNILKIVSILFILVVSFFLPTAFLPTRKYILTLFLYWSPNKVGCIFPMAISSDFRTEHIIITGIKKFCSRKVLMITNKEVRYIANKLGHRCLFIIQIFNIRKLKRSKTEMKCFKCCKTRSNGTPLHLHDITICLCVCFNEQRDISYVTNQPNSSTVNVSDNHEEILYYENAILPL